MLLSQITKQRMNSGRFKQNTSWKFFLIGNVLNGQKIQVVSVCERNERFTDSCKIMLCYRVGRFALAGIEWNYYAVDDAYLPVGRRTIRSTAAGKYLLYYSSFDLIHPSRIVYCNGQVSLTGGGGKGLWSSGYVMSSTMLRQECNWRRFYYQRSELAPQLVFTRRCEYYTYPYNIMFYFDFLYARRCPNWRGVAADMGYDHCRFVALVSQNIMNNETPRRWSLHSDGVAAWSIAQVFTVSVWFQREYNIFIM